MKTRVRKPIRLKAATGRTTPEIDAMQAALEGRTSSRRSHETLWTREFLASGKPGKAPG